MLGRMGMRWRLRVRRWVCIGGVCREQGVNRLGLGVLLALAPQPVASSVEEPVGAAGSPHPSSLPAPPSGADWGVL